jgi:hypothetical protein
MFLSRLNDIMEPRGRIQKDSWIFKEFKVSYQKVEFLALIADLLFIVFSSTFGGTVYRYLWHDNFAIAGTRLSVGLINGFFYVYAVRMRGLYCLPVLLMPLPNVSSPCKLCLHDIFGDRICIYSEWEHRFGFLALGYNFIASNNSFANCPRAFRYRNAHPSVGGKP